MTPWMMNQQWDQLNSLKTHFVNIWQVLIPLPGGEWMAGHIESYGCTARPWKHNEQKERENKSPSPVQPFSLYCCFSSSTLNIDFWCQTSGNTANVTSVYTYSKCTHTNSNTHIGNMLGWTNKGFWRYPGDTLLLVSSQVNGIKGTREGKKVLHSQLILKEVAQINRPMLGTKRTS